MGSTSGQWQGADEELRENLPPGVKLIRTLRGHTGWIGRIVWSPDGRILASPSEDRTIRLWDAESGELKHVLKAHTGWVHSVAWSPDGEKIASASADKTVRLWNTQNGDLLRTFYDYDERVFTVSWRPDGRMIAVGSMDGIIKVWDPNTENVNAWYFQIGSWVNNLAFSPDGHYLALGSGDFAVRLWNSHTKKLHRKMQRHNLYVVGVAWSPDGKMIASASYDHTVRVWDAAGNEIAILEGHTRIVNCVSFSTDGRLLASRSVDGTVRIWNCTNWETTAIIRESIEFGRIEILQGRGELVRDWHSGLAFHPYRSLLATVGSDPGVSQGERDQVIHIYELDIANLIKQGAEPSAHYKNAKVVLVGDTGVGKTGLSLVLNNQPFKETDSTAGRHIWTFDSIEVTVADRITQIRETLLWDLAGQPGYRIIHQLHLGEVAVALVVFDARSEIDPLSGVRHWERALRLAQQRQGTSAMPMKKFLVSARNDRGGVPLSEDRLQGVLNEFGFDGYYMTSSKEGWQIKELREAIKKAIPWESMPEVLSSQLFADIKSFLLDIKKTGWLLAPASQLYDDFANQHPSTAKKVANLRDQFETCIGRMETRDLIRRLTFGDYVLLQPELLDAYASAMVNAARLEPDGLGSLAEEVALAGKFFVPNEQKVIDIGQEQLLLYATVEELVQHDLALRENANDGRYLVFPSQINRDYEDAPEPKGKSVAITFEGPVQSLYATLAVRLGHSGLFTTGRAKMWRNAVVFTANAGGKCGVFLQEFAEAHGRVILFFDEHASPETRFHFEEFILAHTRHHALEGTIALVRFFICSNGHPIPNEYVKLLLAQGRKEFVCPCGAIVSLADPKERILFRSEVEAMDRSADRQRDFDAFIMSAKGETSTRSFQDWAGGSRVTLAIVFTDVVGSTALGEKLKDSAMNEVRRAHFAQSRKLIKHFEGREIKTIGDSFMAAFRSVDAALDYARAIHGNTGHPHIRIRAGIHIGPMYVEEGDVFGGTVNFAARVVGAIEGPEIWLSDRAKEDIDRLGAKRYNDQRWKRHDGVAMKGFPGMFTLWSVMS